MEKVIKTTPAQYQIKILLLLLIFNFSACKFDSKSHKGEQNEKRVLDSNKIKENECYFYNANNTVINFNITSLENNRVIGKLEFFIDGKDSNIGTFEGNLTGDKLFGKYTFISEGEESIREVAFLIKDNQLFEGYGELNDLGNAFIDKNNLSYDYNFPLSKTKCDID